MSGKLLDVDELQLMPIRQATDRYEREVREMLMIDGVELIPFHEPP